MSKCVSFYLSLFHHKLPIGDDLDAGGAEQVHYRAAVFDVLGQFGEAFRHFRGFHPDGQLDPVEIGPDPVDASLMALTLRMPMARFFGSTLGSSRSSSSPNGFHNFFCFPAEYFIYGSGFNQTATFQVDDPVHTLRQVRVMGGDKGGQPGPAHQFQQYLKHVRCRRRVQIAGRFVR